jgi:hypothetical protein
VRAAAHSPGPPASVGRFGESHDHLPDRKPKRDARSVRQSCMPYPSTPVGGRWAHDAVGPEQAMNPETIEPDFVDRNNLDRRSNTLLGSAL